MPLIMPLMQRPISHSYSDSVTNIIFCNSCVTTHPVFAGAVQDLVQADQPAQQHRHEDRSHQGDQRFRRLGQDHQSWYQAQRGVLHRAQKLAHTRSALTLTSCTNSWLLRSLTSIMRKLANPCDYDSDIEHSISMQSDC